MCTSPSIVRIPGQKHCMLVPCRHCAECLKQMQNDWMIRLYEESKCWKRVLFWTFTYNDANIHKVEYVDDETGEVSYDYTLCKKDIQNCIKRVRMRFFRCFEEKLVCKYFLCGEYGSRTHRPHLHMIFFTNDDHITIRSFFRSDWEKRFGFFYCYNDLVRNRARGNKPTDSLFAVARYVSKYATKGIFVTDFEKSHPWVQKSFRLCSNGIGSSYITSSTIRHHLCRDLIGHTHFPLHKPNSQLYSDEFVKLVVSRRFYHFPSCPDIDFHLPRYYSDRIYRTKIVRKIFVYKDLYEEFDYKIKRGCPEGLWSKCIKTTRFVTHSLLQSQVADFLRERAYQVFADSLERIRQNRPYYSDSDAYALALAQENDEMDTRSISAFQSLSRFYFSNENLHPALC